MAGEAAESFFREISFPISEPSAKGVKGGRTSHLLSFCSLEFSPSGLTAVLLKY